ncbi:MAG: acylphosphatase [Deltaproteobacteria bacterium]|nr:acylphosphatase [Deltaproteobacteria bacterium]
METDQDQVRVHLTVQGRVQGVYFRASALQKAQSLGLTGWVRNCPGGSVEAMAEGSRDKVEDLIAWCRVGPPGARVEGVDVKWQAATREFPAFEIRR